MPFSKGADPASPRPPGDDPGETMPDFTELSARADAAASLIRMIANQRRLLLLCHMLEEGEVTVGTLAGRVGLSQSATSQHLKLLRRDALVATRREGTIIHYRIADERVAQVIRGLHGVFREA